ncbi:MAG TPA: hypothetical protein PKA88_07860 [Polyangiaceae bacterium]|nr:hypothetical protein [Polyangiaceae bacterium]HMR76419.1 hypothetical protein [Polyangiaceae bacterium]
MKAPTTGTLVALTLLSACVWTGCSKERPAEPQGSQAAAEPKAAAPEAKPQARYDEATFALELTAAGTYKAGEAGEVTVVLTAKEPFKCNDKYPYKLKLDENEGVKLERAVLTKDAIALEKQKAVMTVPITPSAPGARRVSGEFSFSVCSDDKCLIEKRKLALDVSVE